MTEVRGENVMGLPETVLEHINRANRGDRVAAEALGPWLDQHPEVWRHVGDQVRRAQDELLGLMTGSDCLVDQEAIRRTLAAMRDDLAGPTPTLLEQLLAERIALCWLHVAFLERCTVAAMQEGASPEPRSMIQREFEMKRISAHQKWLGQAHHRYLKSINSLAQIRKLQRPAMQLNIAENQVNLWSPNSDV